jgi:hypothetical protein
MPYPTDHAPGRDTTEWDPTYRSLSAMAVVALLFGLLSPVVAFGSLLVAAPCAAIALGVLALRRIAHSDGALTGRGLALSGLSLGVLCLCAWIAQGQTSRLLTHAQAVPVAEAWFDHIAQGKVESAFLLTLPREERGPMAEFLNSPEHRNAAAPDGDSLTGDSSIADPASDPESQLRRFRESPAVASLLGEGRIAGNRLVGRGAVVDDGRGRTFVTQQYDVEIKDQGPRGYSLVMQRVALPPLPGQSQATTFWRVADIQLAKPDA